MMQRRRRGALVARRERIDAPDRHARVPIVRQRQWRYRSRSSPVRNCSLRSGMIVSASTSETSTAIVSVIESAEKNWPTTPVSSPSGGKTTTVVSVEVVTGQISSCNASRIAARRSGCELHVTHDVLRDHDQASSMTSPIAIAIAPSVIRLNVCPSRDMTPTVIASVSGMDGSADRGHAPVAQEYQQHDHREHRADEHRVAHRASARRGRARPDRTRA